VLVLLLGAASARAGASSELVEEDDAAREYPVTVQLQGGVEGYTGALASRIDIGATYGVSLAYDPSPFLGVEVGFTGAENELRLGPSGDQDPNPGAPDLLRNGGYVIVTPGFRFQLPSERGTFFKPYALGGLGLDRYSPQGLTGALGYTAQTVTNVPFGAGLKARVGRFTADARVNYAWEFNERFSIFDDHPIRIQGQVLVGASF
jgi:hypothetical protein